MTLAHTLRRLWPGKRQPSERARLRAAVNGLPEAGNALAPEPIAPEIRHALALGRAALSRPAPIREEPTAPRVQAAREALFALLWHSSPTVQRWAALSIAGGNRESAASRRYSHFAGSLLRALHGSAPTLPAGVEEQSRVLADALNALLTGQAGELRGLGNMGYSFLSGPLYLALFATCLDTLDAVRRVGDARPHVALCVLLERLAVLRPGPQLNARDLRFVGRAAARALAAMPPDRLPDLWRGLQPTSEPGRQAALAPALNWVRDGRAVPFVAELVQAHLTADSSASGGNTAALTASANAGRDVLRNSIALLGRMGDVRGLPALQLAREHPSRAVRAQARTASERIGRGSHDHPARHLLRALHRRPEHDVELLHLLPFDEVAPHELLRTSDATETAPNTQQAGTS